MSLFSQVKDYYGDCLKSMKIYKTSNFLFMMGVVTANGHISESHVPASNNDLLFVKDLSQRLYSQTYKMSVQVNSSVRRQDHVTSINFENAA